MEEQPCLFCGGDASEPDHLLHCDGRQGGRDEPPMVTITTPRETSVTAFYNAVDAGIIDTRRAQVWMGLKEIGEGTAGEIFEHLKEARHLGLRYDSNTHARLTELRDLGFIREVGQRACRITGQVCLTWTVVSSAEYAGPAIVHRCPLCNQIVSRDVPLVGAK